MATPHKCPVCNGTGTVPNQESTAATKQCPACHGACVLWDRATYPLPFQQPPEPWCPPSEPMCGTQAATAADAGGAK